MIAGPIGLVATAVKGYPTYGCDPLDFVGAGTGLGAGAGADEGGASVGFGFGADDVGWLAGCEELPGPLLGATAADRGPGEADAEGWLEPVFETVGDALPVGAAVGVGEPLVLWRLDDVLLDVVPARLCAAVLANSVVSPNAVTTLSRVARQVRRDNRRSPLSRLALSFRCLMAATSSGQRLRAHQDCPSGLLLLPFLAGRGGQDERENAHCPGCAQPHRGDSQRPASVDQVVD